MTKEELVKIYGEVYTTDDVREKFEIIAFAAPYVVVTRKSDGKKGSMGFQHSPRFYFDFMAN